MGHYAGEMDGSPPIVPGVKTQDTISIRKSLQSPEVIVRNLIKLRDELLRELGSDTSILNNPTAKALLAINACLYSEEPVFPPRFR